MGGTSKNSGQKPPILRICRSNLHKRDVKTEMIARLVAVSLRSRCRVVKGPLRGRDGFVILWKSMPGLLPLGIRPAGCGMWQVTPLAQTRSMKIRHPLSYVAVGVGRYQLQFLPCSGRITPESGRQSPVLKSVDPISLVSPSRAISGSHRDCA